MTTLLNFELNINEKLSGELHKIGVKTFSEAIRYIALLPGGEVSNNRKLELLIAEHRGSVSSKHAFLAQLAIENNIQCIRPVLCAYNLNQFNSQGIQPLLDQNQLHAIPEVVCLIKCHDTIFDITQEDMIPNGEIISDIEISPWQISSFKKRYHLNYIENWIELEKVKHLNVHEIWQVRNECLQIISSKKSTRAQLCCA